MKSLDEVIKSLECCIECGYCEDCPYYNGNEDCSTKSLQDTIIYLKDYKNLQNDIKLKKFIEYAEEEYGVKIIVNPKKGFTFDDLFGLMEYAKKGVLS